MFQPHWMHPDMIKVRFYYQSERTANEFNLKSGCGYTCAARGVERERCVMVVKTGCVMDGKICMSQRKIMKTVIAPEKTCILS